MAGSALAQPDQAARDQAAREEVMRQMQQGGAAQRPAPQQAPRPAPQQAPQPQQTRQPQAQQQQRQTGGAWGHGGPGFTPNGAQQSQGQREQAAREEVQRQMQQNQQSQNRGNQREDRNDNRNNNWNNNRNDGRDNNWRNNNGGNRSDYRGPRRDYSGWRDYHRDYRAPRRYRAPAYRRPAGWYDRRWTFGEFLPSLFWTSTYWLTNFQSYDLPPPPYGAVWVRNGNDALLIDRDSGEIISIEYGVFY
jgi:Ni/Co efflux regulator RcnB